MKRPRWTTAAALPLLFGCSESKPAPPHILGVITAPEEDRGVGPVCDGDCSCEGACCPQAAECYGTEAGDECMAQRDNSQGTTNRLQFRMTWSRSELPAGNRVEAVYDVLANAAGLPWPECRLANGDPGLSGGFIQLLDMDLSDDDPRNHTTRVGYASRVEPDALPTVRTEGLCMVEASFENPEFSLGPEDMSSTEGWPEYLPHPMPMPWQVRPVVARRIDADFDLAEPGKREALLEQIALDEGMDGIFYLDDETGYSHGYSPLAWVVLYVGATPPIAIPIREAETFYQVNDRNERSCIGAYLGNKLDPATCQSPGQGSPPWGCADDSCPPGEAPGRVEGYFLITEMDQILSPLQTTLCISYPTRSVATADGYPDISCQASPNWNPSKPDQSGLPTGDWCAKTNGPATDTCHDAFRNVVFQTYQAFPIRDETCGF